MSTVRAAITSSVFLVALGGHLMAATVQVGTCRSGLVTFSTIQSAVNASPAGATILVCPGTYPEQAVVNKPLTLRGVQSGTLGAAVIVAPPGGIVQNTYQPGNGQSHRGPDSGHRNHRREN